MNTLILLFLFPCVFAMDTTWWKHTIIYEVFIWSFKDSDGDGIGDIKGVTMMLDHFVDIRVETIYMSPFFKSPMLDSGYDVSNYTEIDPLFGTMEDYDELVEEMRKRGMKLIIDFVINHSSDEHPWFQYSIDKIPPYTDYYIWKDPKGRDKDGNPIPPNNWLSIFGGKAWEWNEKRQQFYFHHFSEKQPDFDLRDRVLKKNLFKTVEFWLKKGIAGMRLDAANFFMEDTQLRDEPWGGMEEFKHYKNKWFRYDHIYTLDHPDTYEFVREVRKVIDKFNAKQNDMERILMVEAHSSLNTTLMYYGDKNRPITHFPFNFLLNRLIRKFENAQHFRDVMHKWLDNMPEGATPNWNVEQHDSDRVATRLNQEYSDIMIITEMMAPGTVYLYYGQEIGMANYKIRDDQRKDNFIDAGTLMGRDGERTPMQWDDTINAGFTANRLPWLPVNSDYWRVNVKTEKNKKNSKYHLFKTLSSLRKTETLKRGEFKSYVISTWIFAFTRTLEGKETYVVVHNLGSETEIIDLHSNIRTLTPTLEVVASSLNSGYTKGTKIDGKHEFPEAFTMRPLSSIVFKTMG